MIRRGAVRNTSSIAGARSRSGGGEAGHLGVGRVDQEQVHALLAQPGEGPQVGDPLVERELVHLEVAGVQHQAPAGPDRHRQAVRDRVVDRDELAVEGPEPLPASLGDLDGLRGDAVLLELGLDEREGQLGADQRDVAAFAQQVGHAADVVLVAVRQHDRLDLVEAVRIQVKSGRITSMPGWFSSGNRTPQSTMSSRPACSKTVMLRPISPSPPSGTTRRPPLA